MIPATQKSLNPIVNLPLPVKIFRMQFALYVTKRMLVNFGRFLSSLGPYATLVFLNLFDYVEPFVNKISASKGQYYQIYSGNLLTTGRNIWPYENWA